MISGLVKAIVRNYSGEPVGVKTNLVRLLMSGKLAGTGKLLILPVDQGFEHGPLKSFDVNPPAYDPDYHFDIAVSAGVSAYAAPLGMLQASADTYAGQVPLILKLNSSTSLRSASSVPDQAITASINDALRLGCIGVGFTLYPGSDQYFDMVEELAQIIEEARQVGLLVLVWAYARGGDLSKNAEVALDVISYGAHMACVLGAHIVKVKLPTADIDSDFKPGCDLSSLAARVNVVKQSCFAGKRLVIFSGGASKNFASLLEEVEAIKAGGGDGSIIGRNTFQRPRLEALKVLNEIMELYKK